MLIYVSYPIVEERSTGQHKKMKYDNTSLKLYNVITLSFKKSQSEVKKWQR
jgi:hypothetical protein